MRKCTYKGVGKSMIRCVRTESMAHNTVMGNDMLKKLFTCHPAIEALNPTALKQLCCSHFIVRSVMRMKISLASVLVVRRDLNFLEINCFTS